jgi:hypothetical protein
MLLAMLRTNLGSGRFVPRLPGMFAAIVVMHRSASGDIVAGFGSGHRRIIDGT